MRPVACCRHSGWPAKRCQRVGAPVWGAEEDAGHAEHADHGEHLVAAPHLGPHLHGWATEGGAGDRLGQTPSKHAQPTPAKEPVSQPLNHPSMQPAQIAACEVLPRAPSQSI